MTGHRTKRAPAQRSLTAVARTSSCLHDKCGDQLLDVRPARIQPGDPSVFTLRDTRLAGNLPEPDIYVGPWFDASPMFAIVEANNTINVYAP
ncbi:MAG: hypothetical protein R6W77_15755 [Trueperaceae bacterium]